MNNYLLEHETCAEGQTRPTWELDTELVKWFGNAKILEKIRQNRVDELASITKRRDAIMFIPRISALCGAALPSAAIEWLKKRKDHLHFSTEIITRGNETVHCMTIKLDNFKMKRNIFFSSLNLIKPQTLYFETSDFNYIPCSFFNLQQSPLDCGNPFSLTKLQAEQWGTTYRQGHELHPCKFYFTEEEWLSCVVDNERYFFFFLTMSSIPFLHTKVFT